MEDKTINYTQTKIRVSPRWHIRYFLFRALKVIIYQCGIIYEGARRENKYIHLLKADNETGEAYQFNSEYGYKDAQREFEVVKYYHDQLLHPSFDTIYYESSETYRLVVEMVSKVLSADPSVDTIVNFGVSYAYVDSILAKKFPKVKFIGIDRSFLTKEFNEKKFKDIPNMEFSSENFFDYIKGKDLSNAAILHVRTLVVLPPSFIRKLYKVCREAKFKYIMGMEQFGMSRQTHSAYTFTEGDQASVLFRGFMYIHNYPGLAKQAGYQPIDFEVFPMLKYDLDYHMAGLVAKRID